MYLYPDGTMKNNKSPKALTSSAKKADGDLYNKKRLYMKYQFMRRSMMLGLLAIIFTLAFPSASKADPLVLAGFDLFTTQPGTQVNLAAAGLGIQPFIGVPLGTFDFGTGPVVVFTTDTVVQRLTNATPASPIVPIEIVALQLMSVNQFNLGTGTDFLFVTLQSARGGPASTGTLTITFGPEGIPHGTFDSTLNVAFDIRFGSLTGPIVFSDTLLLESHDVPWSHSIPNLTLLIPGVNFFPDADFFPVGVFEETKPDISRHVVAATTPEPTTISLLAIGMAGVAARVFKRRKQAPESDRD